MKTSPSRPQAAFSLVEVAIALGIVSFVLLAVAGMMGVGLSASKSAQIDTMQSANARVLLATVATNNFDSFTSSKLYINQDGTTNATINGASIEATVSVVSSPSGLSSEIANKLKLLRIDFAYPAQAPEVNRTTNTVYASRVR